MTTVVFKRGSPPENGPWRSYIEDASTLTFVWQFYTIRVDNVAAWCKEVDSEGIAYGTGEKRETKLLPYSDGPPPDEPGFYCAGRAFIGGALQWVLRATSLTTQSTSRRVEGHAATIWDEPEAGSLDDLDMSPANVVARLRARSAEGRTAVAYAQQYWRTIYRQRPIGCVLRAVRYAMCCDELDGPQYDYQLETIDEVGTYNRDGAELCGLMFTSSRGSDLVPHHAHLILRFPVAKPAPPPAPRPQHDTLPKLKPKGQRRSRGGGAAAAGAALAAAGLLGIAIAAGRGRKRT